MYYSSIYSYVYSLYLHAKSSPNMLCKVSIFMQSIHLKYDVQSLCIYEKSQPNCLSKVFTLVQSIHHPPLCSNISAMNGSTYMFYISIVFNYSSKHYTLLLKVFVVLLLQLLSFLSSSPFVHTTLHYLLSLRHPSNNFFADSPLSNMFDT